MDSKLLNFFRITSTCIFAICTLLITIQAASAQSLLDWFSGNEDTVSDRRLVGFDPDYSPNQIIVSFGDRRLYHIVQRGQAISYPIAVPRGDSRWDGTLLVSRKMVNPPWTPTPSMRRENPSLPATVPGGHPRNPLGVRAIYLGDTLYRIHGTDAPWTIGKNVSRGCIRMHNEHVIELYDKVRRGMRVTATWQRFNPHSIATSQSVEAVQDWPPW
jgi:lipoprotein-anchoring transpeptidase ErfK/SrfK